MMLETQLSLAVSNCTLTMMRSVTLLRSETCYIVAFMLSSVRVIVVCCRHNDCRLVCGLCSKQGPQSYRVQGSIDPHCFSYGVHKWHLTPHFLSCSIAVHALLGAQTGCQTSACFEVLNATCSIVSTLRKICLHITPMAACAALVEVVVVTERG